MYAFAKDEKLKKNPLKKLLSSLKHQVLRRLGGSGSFRQKQDDWPGPTVVENFVTPQEAATLIDRYARLSQQSGHYLHSRATVERQSKYRTSSSIRLPPLGDPLVLDIERRAASLAGFQHGHCEDFQLACYEADALYGLHRDDNDGRSGLTADRVATVLVYLEAPEVDGGGETLFTNEALESEKDLDTKRPLNTEKGALKLFRSYCQRPKRRHQVVVPDVGRAVTWLNWYGKNSTEFARTSTHGACPVKENKGRKCVIQQWISKSSPNPLRDEKVMAIFPMGADSRYQSPKILPEDDKNCFTDVSGNDGSEISALCLHGSTETHDLVDGPMEVGALRIRGGSGTHLYMPISEKSCSGAISTSFWARNLAPKTILFQLEGNGQTLFQVAHSSDENEPNGLIFTLSFPQSGETKSAKIVHRGARDDWIWYSITVDVLEGTARFSAYSLRHLLCSETLSRDSGPCKSPDECSALQGRRIRLFSLSATPDCSAKAFVGDVCKENQKSTIADLSFLILHRGTLDEEKEVLALSKQIERYDISK